MSLSPEERRRIYEEEKARIEGSQPPGAQEERTIKDLKPGTAGLLCYLGGWISGVVFLILEQKDRFVRFHALQSIVLFGFLHLVFIALSRTPFVGPFFGSVIIVLAVILWIILMIKASQEQYFVIPGAGDLAWRLLGSTAPPPQPQQPQPPHAAAQTQPPQQNPSPAQAFEPTPSTTPPATPSPGTFRAAAAPIAKTVKEPGRGRAGRTVASAFAIAWGVVWLVFLNFFNSYIAYYHLETIGGASVWVRDPLVTASFSAWLPVVNFAIAFAIAAHILMLAIDKYALREGLHLLIDIFSLVSTAVLLSIFPFDFSPFGGPAYAVDVSVHVTLIFVIVGVSIGILVRFIKLIVTLARGTTPY
jgi:uncharacterized membrane protein